MVTRVTSIDCIVPRLSRQCRRDDAARRISSRRYRDTEGDVADGAFGTARGGERIQGAWPGDREAQAHHREAAARAVRPVVGAGRAARPARAAIVRARGRPGAGRGLGADRQAGRGEYGTVVHAPQARAPPAAGASAARARGPSVSVLLPVLRREPAQARRGRHRDAGAGAAPVEGGPARLP